MKKIQAGLRKHKDLILYLIFGVLTTVINYIVYLPCYNWLKMSSAFSNVIAWCAAVTFAFLTNKPFVFKSFDWSYKTIMPELTKFLSCRLGSGAFETLALYVTVDILQWNGNLLKMITSVAVIVLNYIASKKYVFQEQNEGEQGNV